ncbi:MAG: four helix bundle protein [Patescibacteria group bacterium]|nr:four helix bundle protein [Patescibacteria group bacterium]
MNSELLYKRLLSFAQRCQKLVVKLPRNVYNMEYSSQLIRSSASPGANYIEAIEASSRKDFIHRLKICRKEAKESIHWLTLIQSANNNLFEIQKDIEELVKEARELIKIFSSSVLTSERNQKMNK